MGVRVSRVFWNEMQGGDFRNTRDGSSKIKIKG
jgi:hypothetical protein